MIYLLAAFSKMRNHSGKFIEQIIKSVKPKLGPVSAKDK